MRPPGGMSDKHPPNWLRRPTRIASGSETLEANAELNSCGSLAEASRSNELSASRCRFAVSADRSSEFDRIPDAVRFRPAGLGRVFHSGCIENFFNLPRGFLSARAAPCVSDVSIGSISCPKTVRALSYTKTAPRGLPARYSGCDTCEQLYTLRTSLPRYSSDLGR